MKLKIKSFHTSAVEFTKHTEKTLNYFRWLLKKHPESADKIYPIIGGLKKQLRIGKGEEIEMRAKYGR